MKNTKSTRIEKLNAGTEALEKFIKSGHIPTKDTLLFLRSDLNSTLRELWQLKAQIMEDTVLNMTPTNPGRMAQLITHRDELLTDIVNHKDKTKETETSP